MTAQGHPRAIYVRAIRARNLVVAELTAREIGSVSLDEALELVCLVAEKAPERLDAYARRWVSRLLEERAVTLGEIDLVVTALRALPSDQARDALRAFV